GARRPAGRYASPARVAAAVVRAIEGHTNDVVLSLSGRVLWLLRDLSPSIVRLAMRHLARRLRVEPEVSHVPT
ncbi:MAG TPA: hypothetical protein VNL18_00620, partial [Gemmatimonadales bacterium]|nr:hypothetical protein [Gemmatimonadales bacterium]